MLFCKDTEVKLHFKLNKKNYTMDTFQEVNSAQGHTTKDKMRRGLALDLLFLFKV